MTEEIGYPKFLKDTAVNKLKDNIYCGNLSDSWSIGGNKWRIFNVHCGKSSV